MTALATSPTSVLAATVAVANDPAIEEQMRVSPIVRERGQIVWIVASDDWRESKLPAGQLRGKPLPAKSTAARVARDFREEEVPLEVWAPRQGWRDATVWESAMETPYGRLMFLAATEADEHEDEEEDGRDSED